MHHIDPFSALRLHTDTVRDAERQGSLRTAAVRRRPAVGRTWLRSIVDTRTEATS